MANIQKLHGVNIEDKVRELKSFSLFPNKESIEIHFNLNINPKIPEQMFVQKCTLPNITGKDVKIIAFVSESLKDSVLKAGVNYLGDEEHINKIKNNKIFFDYCVASPDMMRVLSPLAKILGPRGLMPNAKLGTLTPYVAEAVSELKRGQVSLKNDRYGLVHAMVGRCDMPTSSITDNIEYLIDFVQGKKPSMIKGNLIKRVHISSTQGSSASII